VLRLQMADHRLDSRASSQFALDLLRHAALLPGGVDPQARPRRCVVAAIADSEWVVLEPLLPPPSAAYRPTIVAGRPVVANNDYRSWVAKQVKRLALFLTRISQTG
jgi:hypothetical protein